MYSVPSGSRGRPQSPAPQPVNWGKVLLVGLGALACWKIAQESTDEDYGDCEYPRSVRRDLIAAHVESAGCYCRMCNRRVPRTALSVDHIWPMSKGGRTSLNNAQVICRSCNSSKGNRTNVSDWLRGIRA